MAENKKSFVLYCDLIHTVNKMKDVHAGQLLKTILSYVNDENPKVDNPMVDLVFEPIKRQMKRDLAKYDGVKESKKTSGVLGNLKRWHPDLYERVLNSEITIESASQIANNRKRSQTDRTQSQTVANIAVNVNDNVNVTDTVNDNVTVIKLTPAICEKNISELLADRRFHEETCMAMSAYGGIELLEMIKKLNEFILLNKAGGELEKSYQQCKSHFVRWLKIELKQKQKSNGKGIATAVIEPKPFSSTGGW